MNNNNFKLIHLLLLVFLSNISFAQKRFLAKIDEMRIRENIVIIEAAPSTITNNLKGKQRDIDAVNNMYEEFNNSVKAMIESFWKFGKGVKYMSWEEFDKLDKETLTRFNVLYFETIKPLDNFFKAKRMGYIELEEGMLDDEHGIASYNFIQSFVAGKAEDLKRGKVNILPDYVFSIQLTELIPSGITVAYALRQAQAFFEQKEFKSDPNLSLPKSQNYTTAEKVEEMTLLICRKWFPDDWDINDFKNIYPYIVKLASLEEIEEAVFNQEPNIIYYFFEPKIKFDTKYRALDYERLIIEAKTGKILFSFKLNDSLFTGKVSKSLYEINSKFTFRFLEFNK